MKRRDYAAIQRFIPFWLIFAGAKLYLRKTKRKITWDCPEKPFRHTPVILLLNHSAYTGFLSVPFFPLGRKMHAVAGEIHFGNDFPGYLVETLNCIPIKQYVSDLPAAFAMARCVKAGHSVTFFPEGICSYCGITHPIFPSTASFIKEMKTDVVLAKTDGEFLITPRFCKDKRKGGLIEMHFSHLFTKEELDGLSVIEIEERLANAMRYNDFQWNEEKRFHYKGKYPCAAGLEKIIYYCPKCGGDETLCTESGSIVCRQCGNTVCCDDTYTITPKSDRDVLPYRRIDEWYVDCRRRLRQSIRSHGEIRFSFDVRLNVRVIGHGKPKFREVGAGILTVDRTGTRYRGTENGAESEIFIPIARTYGAALQNEYFLVMYDTARTVAFAFADGGPRIVKAEAAIEEFHATVDPAWDRALCRAYYPEEFPT